MDWTTHNDDDRPQTPGAVEIPLPPQAPPTDLWAAIEDGSPGVTATATDGPGATTSDSASDRSAANATAPDGSAAAPAPSPKDHTAMWRTTAIVSTGILLVAAIGGGGFVLGRAMDHNAPRSASGYFPGLQLPSGGTGGSGNVTNPFNGFGSPFNGFGDGSGGSLVTPTTLPANSPSSAAAAKIASKVDASVVDITTSSSYNSSSAAGTGMILTSNGLVLTNNHVIDGATSITVRVVTTGRAYTAKVLGYSVTKDVALLRLVGASGLTPIVTADSSKVTKAEAVVAIGNAGGVGGTPSYAPGAVVATNQNVTASDEDNLTGAEKLSGMIQVAAAIVAGDSGGPLVNVKGQVVGMDTAGSSGGSTIEINGEFTSNTQGFAIPINTALSIAHTITAGTSTSVVHVGATPIMGIEISPTLSGYQNSGVKGVTIAGLAAGTPAARSGLVAGDVITAIDSQPVSTPTQLSSLVQKLAPGDTVKVSYTNSSGASSSVDVALIAGPAL